MFFPLVEVRGVSEADQEEWAPTPLRILFVDDEPLIRRSLKEALERG
ncbi:MAG: hypothetical protein N3B68_05140 [Anaerolineae bacterium]|nr:hypothetical protein [Anaerolineae bacterium]